MLAAFGIVPAREAKVHQGIEVGVGNRIHMPTPPPVSPIGSTKLFVFLMPKGDAAGATISGGDVNVGFVYKLHGLLKSINKKPRASRRRVMG
jgi:hypothetical protein